MSFTGWVSNGWLVAHKSSRLEIGNLIRIVARDLKDSEAKDVSDDWRFAIAYNAALQAATTALAAAGYRATRESHHYRIIHSLELTVGKDAQFIRAFDAFRKKRNVSNYDIGGGISHREVEEMIATAKALKEDVLKWIRTNHETLL
ncbi:MAG TPA: hypothetical protein VK525_17820 [Candidatus Saccharimonadales bacterium]|nr:hypothetical protein [Candidatus Saccharimonadales bacterium]